MGRPSGKHFDSEELSILVPWSTDTGTGELRRHSSEAVRELHRHLARCPDCRKKVMTYRLIARTLPNAANHGVGVAGSGCPREIEWRDVVGGSWPEPRAQQLISHAASCDHCGPMLRTAIREMSATKSANKAGIEVAAGTGLAVVPRRRWQIFAWSVPACSIVMILAAMVGVPLSSPTTLSAASYAEFAVETHAQHVQGRVPLDIRSDSQRALNEWFRQNVKFPLSLPTSPGAPEETRPFRLEGASLVQARGKRAVFIAYQVDSRPASLMIAPYAVAVASGGIEARFQKVTFHYRIVHGFKVVSWSQHGLTYALVSQEGIATQKSCMVCHAVMKDRDLTQTPTPLETEKNTIRSFLQ